MYVDVTLVTLSFLVLLLFLLWFAQLKTWEDNILLCLRTIANQLGKYYFEMLQLDSSPNYPIRCSTCRLAAACRRERHRHDMGMDSLSFICICLGKKRKI